MLQLSTPPTNATGQQVAVVSIWSVCRITLSRDRRGRKLKYQLKIQMLQRNWISLLYYDLATFLITPNLRYYDPRRSCFRMPKKRRWFSSRAPFSILERVWIKRQPTRVPHQLSPDGDECDPMLPGHARAQFWLAQRVCVVRCKQWRAHFLSCWIGDWFFYACVSENIASAFADLKNRL